MLESLFYTRCPLSRFGYFLHCLAALLIAAGLATAAFETLGEDHHTFPLACFLAIIVAIGTNGFLVLLSLRRQREVHWAPMATLWLFIPGFNLLYMLSLSLAKAKPVAH